MTAQEFSRKYFGVRGSDGNVAVPPAAPAFRTDVKVKSTIDPSTVTNGTPTENGIAPEYCAMNQCAADLASLLAGTFSPPPSVVMEHPFAGWPTANLYIQSDNVPYLRFKGYNVAGEAVTVDENAGQLAYAFAHVPGNQILDYIAWWVRTDLMTASAGDN